MVSFARQNPDPVKPMSIGTETSWCIYKGDCAFSGNDELNGVVGANGNPNAALVWYDKALQLHETTRQPGKPPATYPAGEHPRFGDDPWERFHWHLGTYGQKVRLLLQRAAADGAPENFETKWTLMKDKRPAQTVLIAAELIEVIGTQLKYVLATTRDGSEKQEIFRAEDVEADFEPWKPAN